MVPFDGDVAVFGLFHQLVGENFFRAELVAPVNDGDVRGDVGEVQGFLDRGVAAADHGHGLVAVEEAVTGGAAGDALALELFFRFQSQVHGRGAGGDDQGVAGVAAAVAGQFVGLAAEVHLVDVVENELGVEAFGMLAHAFHQPRALQAFRVAGPVVHFRGGHELPALFHTGDQHRLQVGARGIDGGGVAGGAGSENQKAAMFAFTHGAKLRFGEG